MKIAAELTTNVMSAICRLPGIATLDWCDRAAGALSRLHHPCAAVCALGHVDPRGMLTRVDLNGVWGSCAERAACGTTSPFSDLGEGTSRNIDPDQVRTIRATLSENEWLGWTPGELTDGRYFVGNAAAMGVHPLKPGSALQKRWGWMQPVDVLLAAAMVPGATPGRMIFVEVASSDPAFKDSARERVVLGATLMMLSCKAERTFGPEAEDRMQWLTPREEVVMWRLVAGMKVPEIAKQLHRSVYTVHDHVKSLHRKLNAKNRGQLVARALGHLGPLDLMDEAVANAK